MTPTDLIAQQAAELERMRDRIERLRGSLKTASGWCFDMTDPLEPPTSKEWLKRADLLMALAGDMEPTNLYTD